VKKINAKEGIYSVSSQYYEVVKVSLMIQVHRIVLVFIIKRTLHSQHQKVRRDRRRRGTKSIFSDKDSEEEEIKTNLVRRATRAVEWISVLLTRRTEKYISH
jgi:hypothetical protein